MISITARRLLHVVVAWRARLVRACPPAIIPSAVTRADRNLVEAMVEITSCIAVVPAWTVLGGRGRAVGVTT